MDIFITNTFGWVLVGLFTLDCFLGLVKVRLMRERLWQHRRSDTKLSMNALREALQEDSEYAYSWFTNMSRCLYSGMESGTHDMKMRESKAAVRKFMSETFNVEIP